jgi:hypothetical protein
MMFSDFIRALHGIFAVGSQHIPVLLVFVVFGVLLWKPLKIIVLDGHPLMLVAAAAANYLLIATAWQQGSAALALVLAIPLGFIGRESYRRLVSRSWAG